MGNGSSRTKPQRLGSHKLTPLPPIASEKRAPDVVVALRRSRKLHVQECPRSSEFVRMSPDSKRRIHDLRGRNGTTVAPGRVLNRARVHNNLLQETPRKVVTERVIRRHQRQNIVGDTSFKPRKVVAERVLRRHQRQDENIDILISSLMSTEHSHLFQGYTEKYCIIIVGN